MIKRFIATFCFGLSLASVSKAQDLLDFVQTSKIQPDTVAAGPISLWFKAGAGSAFLKYDGNNTIYLKEVYFRQNNDQTPITYNAAMGVGYTVLERLMFGAGFQYTFIGVNSETIKQPAGSMLNSVEYSRQYHFAELPLFMRWNAIQAGRWNFYAQSTLAPSLFVADRIKTTQTPVVGETTEQAGAAAHSRNMVNFNSRISLGAEWKMAGKNLIGASLGYGQLGASIWRGDFKEKAQYLNLQIEYRRQLTWVPQEKPKSY